SFIIPKISSGAGVNAFELRVDATQQVDELREDNNASFLEYFIPENATRNLYPANFAITARRQVSLSFQHTNVTSEPTTFELEVDTSASFNSAFKQFFTIEGKVLVRQQIDLLAVDSLVYYWRTRLANPGPTESNAWFTTSFTFIDNGPEGWAQSHFPQYFQNELTGLAMDSVTRRLDFVQSVIPVFIRTFGASAGAGAGDVSVLIDNAEYNLYTQGFGCRTNTINLIAFDKTSTAPYQGVSFQWYNSGGRGCGRVPWVINSFTYSELLSGNGDDLVAYVDNIKAGDSVIMFNIGNAYYELWPEEVKLKLGEIGISISQLDMLSGGEPVIVFAKKGIAPGNASVIEAPDADPSSAQLEVSRTITGRFTAGEMRSTRIGPALVWGKLSFKFAGMSPNDQAFVSVYGIDGSGREDLIMDSLVTDTELGAIAGATFRYLRLVYQTSDPVELTAAQLTEWMVAYEPSPEGVVFYNGTNAPETVQEGITWNGQYGFVNVTDADFSGPLTVRYKLTNNSTFATVADTVFIDPPQPFDTTLFTIPVNTFQRPGTHDVEVFVNPYLFPEAYYDNNLMGLPAHLTVIRELFQPVIDVTFDGRYLSRDEFVSPNPDIEITLWDENDILKKTDTAGIELYLSVVCDQAPCTFRRVNLSDPRVAWTAATDTTDFRILFRPGPLDAGRYVLRVNVTDETGNSAGSNPYEISFRFSPDNRIELSPIFPNPLRESIGIDLTLSERGGDDELVIEIYQLNGYLEQTYLIPASALHVGHNNLRIVLERRPAAGLYIYRLRFSNAHGRLERTGKIAVVR
ncbi:MAG TPA: hypothetical protein VEB86_12465, partial [Chryseosolibacter sp.]|nr:hypothetical protein [Chryseosolibacter sp.]